MHKGSCAWLFHVLEQMATALRPALSAFRRLMRARELAFKGDAEMMKQSRLAVREEFLRHRVWTPL